MKNIIPASLPHFHGLTSEDLDYDYVSDEQKLNLFPSSLKYVAFHYFMSLLGGNITTWT